MHGRNRIGSPYTKSIIQMTHLGKQEIVTVMAALEMKSNAISIRYDHLKQTSVITDRYGKISLLHQCWLHPALLQAPDCSISRKPAARAGAAQHPAQN